LVQIVPPVATFSGSFLGIGVWSYQRMGAKSGIEFVALHTFSHFLAEQCFLILSLLLYPSKIKLTPAGCLGILPLSWMVTDGGQRKKGRTGSLGTRMG